jgi:hypothetical protein
MLMHLAESQRFHGPLIAFAATLALALGSRLLRIGMLGAAAGGAGVVAGWFALTGRLWVAMGTPSAGDLAGFAAIVLVIGLLVAWAGPGRAERLGPVLAALVGVWVFLGAPRHVPASWANWPVGLGAAVAVLLFARLFASGSAERLRLALAGLTLAASLHVAGAAPLWIQLALVPGVAALAMLALPQLAAAAALPVAADIAAMSCLAVVILGRLPSLGVSPTDAAALSPLLAGWLQPRTVQRLSGLGRTAPLAGTLLAGAIAVGCVWAVRLVLGR